MSLRHSAKTGDGDWTRMPSAAATSSPTNVARMAAGWITQSRRVGQSNSSRRSDRKRHSPRSGSMAPAAGQFGADDRPRDIARVILGKLSKGKAEKVAREILNALKAS